MLVNKIKDLWESNEARPIIPVMKDLIDLLSKAKNQGEAVPIDLEIEILLAANYAFGYGGDASESKALLQLLQRVIFEPHNIDRLQIHRLACTVASAMLTQVVSDSQRASNDVEDMLRTININETTLKDQLIAISNLLLHVLEPNYINSWSLELISFIITYRSIILVINDESSQFKEKPIKTLLTNSYEGHKEEIQNWQSYWLEKEDYFRFITLMALDKHAPEGLWRKQASLLTGLN